jgi:hypothetical protein
MAAAPTATARHTSGESGLPTLDVPYFSQRDSATAQGDRMCFSSTCAMAAEFLKPDCLAGAGQRDDRYLALVQHFGDTTWGCPNSMDRSHAAISTTLSRFAWRFSKSTGVE